MLRPTLIWLGVLGIVLTSGSGSAAVFDRQGHRIPESQFNYRSIDWQMMDVTAAYRGIGLIKIRQSSTCTGFLIRTQATAPAYVLTNAHCIDLLSNLPSAQEIITNRILRNTGRAGAPLTFTPSYFAQAPDGRRSYAAERVVYATMKNNDLALLELSPTQGELSKIGLVGLSIANQPSAAGEKIEVVGIPSVRVPFDRQFIHRATCLLGPTVSVKEGVYTWPRSLRNRCSIVSGMSGSPILVQGKVIGMMNTGGTEVLPRSQKCILDQPCEVISSKKIFVTGSENYGQLLTPLANCFTDRGVFNLSQPGCRLEQPH
jgi:V8-like Glu-specific endopeptidase